MPAATSNGASKALEGQSGYYTSPTLPESHILNLANNIARQSAHLAAYLQAQSDSSASRLTTAFGPDALDPPETPEYNALRSSLKASLEDMQRLVDGPRGSMRSLICSGNDLAAFQVAFDFGFFNIVPLEDGGEVAIEELAAKAGMDVDRTAHVVRMLATHRVFHEKRPGFVAHTAASAIFARDEDLACAGHYIVDEMWKAAASTGDAIRASPHESDAQHCAFNTGLGMPLFAYYAQHPKLATRFAKAMAGVTQVDRQIGELRDCFQWGDLKGPVVDVGGGSGHVSMALARAFPHLSFVVQDGSLDMLAQGKRLLSEVDDLTAPGSNEPRVAFMQHNFFEPQPLRNAAAFFIRQCTHNWCDRDVVTILRGFVPGLEGSAPGTPLLINDTILPVPGTIPLSEERSLRQLDMLMMISLGAKQRTLAEFEGLLRQADARFRIRAVHASGTMGLLEVCLDQPDS